MKRLSSFVKRAAGQGRPTKKERRIWKNSSSAPPLSSPMMNLILMIDTVPLPSRFNQFGDTDHRHHGLFHALHRYPFVTAVEIHPTGKQIRTRQSLYDNCAPSVPPRIGTFTGSTQPVSLHRRLYQPRMEPYQSAPSCCSTGLTVQITVSLPYLSFILTATLFANALRPQIWRVWPRIINAGQHYPSPDRPIRW